MTTGDPRDGQPIIELPVAPADLAAGSWGITARDALEQQIAADFRRAREARYRPIDPLLLAAVLGPEHRDPLWWLRPIP